VDGRVVVRAGEVQTLDEGAVLRAMQEEAPRFVALAREWDARYWPDDSTKPHDFSHLTARSPR